ncbi:DNA translocase FtsK [Pseudomonas viridiflava]|uniref:DNA translocase FtsK n=1 Tax=Pseudomonas viridiflava TaxID=33069 RepID=UPI000F080847|nr:DNA translocase FtsK [Pseudomonas viridiflava]
MSNEKMREEFESVWGFTNEEQECYFIPELNFYGSARVNRAAESKSTAWAYFQKGWKASREALEQSAISPEVQAMLSQFDADEVEEVRAAEAFIRESGRCSISALQRKFLIGYNRACRLMDKLVALKVVSPIDAEGHRTVLPEQVKP